jgi:4-amino-4-deoxy-L-arabinose transferase-like glycosyltransferase
MKQEKKTFFFIIILAFILRFFSLGKTPPGLYWDEVSLGYNAYSILKTARDEHGEILPYSRFIAFGDYKPPGYIYATILPIAIFGLNEFSVRFPSALSGVLMVIITYFLIKTLFPNKKIKFFNQGISLALAASFLLCISPWSLHLSRVAFEANLAALFNLLAIYFFIKGIKTNKNLILLSSVFFALTLYTFNSNRLLTPILIFGLTLIFFKNLIKIKKTAVLAIIIFITLVLPLIPHLTSREGKLRWHEVNIFSNFDVILESNKRIDLDGGGFWAKKIHHRFIGHALNFLKHYFDHFKGDYLFLSGDVNPRLSVRYVGELYLVELPFFLAGIFFLLNSIRKKSAQLILFWFLAAPIPAATARETPHALRTLSILPTPQIISALGIYQIFLILYKIINKNFKILFSVLICFAFLLNILYYLYAYYSLFPKRYIGEWLPSYKELVQFLNQYQDAKQILVTQAYGRPYIYFLFYNQYSPRKFQLEAKKERDWFGFWQVLGIDNLIFTDDLSKISNTGKILLALPPNVELVGFEKIKTIYEDDKPTFEIFKRE